MAKTLDKVVRARVDRSLAKKVREQAKREGIPESQIVRRALRNYFAAEAGA